jgi:hypothetical protein
MRVRTTGVDTSFFGTGARKTQPVAEDSVQGQAAVREDAGYRMF